MVGVAEMNDDESLWAVMFLLVGIALVAVLNATGIVHP